MFKMLKYKKVCVIIKKEDYYDGVYRRKCADVIWPRSCGR